MDDTTQPAGNGPVQREVRQHTPGPWHWEADEVKGDPTGRVRYQVTALGKTVTRVYYSSFEGGLTNAEADAKLIAAAPELLSALRDLEAMAERYRQPGAPIPDAQKKARAAIVKAVGSAA